MQPTEFNTSSSVSKRSESLIATNTVLRNTYLLLSMTLLFSAGVAGTAMALNLPYPNLIVAIVGMYGLMFLTHYTRNSPMGLVSVFAFTGFMGYTLGPLLNLVLYRYANGAEMIMTALGGTGLIFFSLSGYVLTTRKDFSFMTGFLIAGTVVALIAMIANLFFNIPGLQLAMSAVFTLLSSGWILWQTSAIIHGGERNYISATVMLYVQIYNLFISLLHLIMAFSGRE